MLAGLIHTARVANPKTLNPEVVGPHVVGPEFHELSENKMCVVYRYCLCADEVSVVMLNFSEPRQDDLNPWVPIPARYTTIPGMLLTVVCLRVLRANQGSSGRNLCGW